MRLLDASFLAASHWIAVLYAGSLNSFNAGFKSIRFAELHSPVGQYVFEQREKGMRSKPFFHTIEDQPHCTGGAAVHQESQEEFFTREKERQQNLF